jgi:hypothetical protein
MSGAALATDYPAQVAEAVAAARVTATGFAWRGSRHLVLPAPVRRSLTPADQRQWLVSRLESYLYSNFYCLGGVRAERPWPAPSSHATTVRHVQRLSVANRGDDHFDPDWWVVSADAAQLVVIKDGLRLRVDRADCRSDMPLLQGVEVSVRTAKECFGMTPGFYLAIGSAPGAIRGSAGTLARLYWNVTPRGAITLVEELTTLLNGHNVGFRLKALRDPTAYTRCDAAVLYLSKESVLSVWDGLAAVYQRVSDELKSRVPAMTRALAPGLGIAEDPGDGNSFGLHRCGLIAEGLLRAHEARQRSPSRRLAAVVDCLETAGVDVAAPYLGPGMVDDYPSLRAPTSRAPRSAGSAPDAGPDAQLAAAHTIGRQLAAAALRDRDWCTWLGYQPDSAPTRRHRGGVFGTTGPCLYDGAAGIAWFLAELCAVTGDELIGCTARAALTGAMRAAPELPGALFAGWVGIAVAAAYAAEVLGAPELARAAADLLERSLDTLPANPDWDLLTGDAGVVVGLLALAELLGEPSLVDHAVRAGERLIEAAERRPGQPGCSWPSGARRQPNLVGLSHGTSGPALALGALAAETGRSDFDEIASQAVAYERSRFDPEQRAWPDLRHRSAGGPAGRERFPFYWCHGTPGIAVARLAVRGAAATAHTAEGLVALRSTCDAMTAQLADGHHPGCLCHGLVGNALVLLEGARAAAVDDAADYAVAAQPVAARLAATVHGGGSVFGESVADVDNPSLMLGYAGIGHFLLRAAGVATGFRSPLWPVAATTPAQRSGSRVAGSGELADSARLAGSSVERTGS